MKLAHAARQWTQTEQQIYNRMSDQEQNQIAAMAQSKSRAQPAAGWDLKRAVHTQCPQISMN